MKICVITGTRAEYGIFRPVLQAITNERSLTLQLAVTGMHLLKQFGHTIDDIRADGWPIAATVPMYAATRRATESPAAALARGLKNFDAALAQLQPDLILLLGDRLEILAAASAALARQIPIAHLHGGETAPGQFDEQIRHAVTKMAALHFVATKQSAARVRQMGEPKNRIHIVGAPALDRAVACDAQWRKTKTANLIYPLLVLHPSTPDDALEQRRAEMLIDTIREMQPVSHPILTIGPNNDPGHRGILAAYKSRAASLDLIMSLPQEQFWERLWHAGLLIGNSSSGIIEAASLGCIAINIGDRQRGRERSRNVIDVPWQRTKIIAALKTALWRGPYRAIARQRKNVYGHGGSGERIARILATTDIKSLAPHPKRFVDLRPLDC